MIADSAIREEAAALDAILRRAVRGMERIPDAACCHETACVTQDLDAALDALAGLLSAVEDAATPGSPPAGTDRRPEGGASTVDARDIPEVTLTATVSVTLRVADLLRELSIEDDAWGALDAETQWAVLQTPEAAETAMQTVLGSRVGQDVIGASDETQCDAPEPESLSALLDRNWDAYWHRRRRLAYRAGRLLDGAPLCAVEPATADAEDAAAEEVPR